MRKNKELQPHVTRPLPHARPIRIRPLILPYPAVRESAINIVISKPKIELKIVAVRMAAAYL